MRRNLTIITCVGLIVAFILGAYVLVLCRQSREMTLEDASEIPPAASSVSVTAESVPDGVLLRWRDMEGVSVDYYDIYRRRSDGEGAGKWLEWRQVKQRDIDFHEYLDEDVSAGETYSYYVRLVGISGQGEAVTTTMNSVEVTFRPAAETPP